MDIIFIQQTTLAPTSIVKDSNTTGAVTDIDDPVDSPDGAKLEVVDETANFLVRCQFTPPPNLTPGAGLQQFRAWVMKNAAGGSNPSCQLTLAEAGSSLRALTGATITSELGQLVEGTFDIDEVLNDANTECRLDGLTSTNRNIDIDAVEWVATHDASAAPSYAAGELTLSTPPDVLLESAAPAYAAGNLALFPAIELESATPDFAAGELQLSLISGTIELTSPAPAFVAGSMNLGVTAEITLQSAATGFAAGELTVAAGDPLITFLSALPGFRAGVPKVRRVDIPPDLLNRIKPGTWRLS